MSPFRPNFKFAEFAVRTILHHRVINANGVAFLVLKFVGALPPVFRHSLRAVLP